MPYVSQVKGSDNVIYDIRAKELVPSVVTEGNQIPYNYRATNGGYVSDIGNREIDTLVGGTVAWNQLNKNNVVPFTSNGVMYSSDGGGNITANGTPSARTYCYTEASPDADLYGVGGHVFLSNVVLKSGTIPEGVTFGGGFYEGSTWINHWTSTKRVTVFKAPNNATRLTHTAIDITQAVVDALHGGSVNFTVSTNFFDLTQMFGSTIADYIYSLEQGTAGAGVAFFRSLFPNDYYAYNAGELMSVKTSAHKTVGFNLWDEKIIKNKCIASDGGITDHTEAILSENYIKAFPNISYRFVCKSNVSGVAIGFFDETYTFISRVTSSGTTSFSTPANCRYIRFSVYVYGTDYIKPDYDNDICISIYNSDRLNDYEKYNGHTYPLASNLELRGIPKLDSNNNLYYDGDTYSSDGSVARKYHVYTFTGQESVTGGENLGTYYRWRITVSGFGDKTTHYSLWSNGVQPLYNYTSDTSHYYLQNGVVWYFTKATTATTVATEITGTSLVADVQNPTTESATPYTNPQICDPYGTEEYTDTRDVQIPVGHTTTYYHYNERSKLDSLPSSADTGDGVYLVTQTAGQMSLTAFSPNDKMDKDNPTGTGSLSLNRKASTTVGTNSVAVGNNTTASGYVSHAEGNNTTASANYTHAEGSNTTASGEASHAEGNESKASGFYSHAENYFTTAAGMGSHTEGRYTAASHRSQHVFGEYNAIDPSTATATNKGNYVEIVGNGTGVSDRSNARTLDWSGNEVLAGGLKINGNRDVIGVAEITGTLTAGSTSITLQATEITSTSTIDIYVSTFGIQPTNAVVSTGTITLTFLAQASDITVKVRVS